MRRGRSCSPPDQLSIFSKVERLVIKAYGNATFKSTWTNLCRERSSSVTPSAQKPQEEPRYGSATSNEIYLSVGVALSFWESSEDLLESLFETICQRTEAIGFETFCVAPRQSRDIMLLSALAHYSDQVLAEESQQIKDAVRALGKLAKFRNEIAHGYVSHQTRTVDGSVTMQGNFLISAQDPTGMMGRRQNNLKYAHTAAEIDEWREKVRVERGVILDVQMAIVVRRQGKHDG